MLFDIMVLLSHLMYRLVSKLSMHQYVYCGVHLWDLVVLKALVAWLFLHFLRWITMHKLILVCAFRCFSSSLKP